MSMSKKNKEDLEKKRKKTEEKGYPFTHTLLVMFRQCNPRCLVCHLDMCMTGIADSLFRRC